MTISVAAEAMDPETERRPARDTKDRKPVPAPPGSDLKVVRCLYTGVCRREASRTAIQKRSLRSTYPHWNALKLIESGVISHAKDGVKILGNGELTKKLNVKANGFSAAAKEKIEAKGGTAEVV